MAPKPPPRPFQLDVFSTTVTLPPFSAAAEPEGIALSVLGKRVRGKFRTFKLRDLGYAQFRPYLDDLDGIKVEQRDGQSYARLDR